MESYSGKSRKGMTVAILSLSLLTVMAGAAVAPALGVIKAYFSDVNSTYVQMIISMPALFIVITNFIFPQLAARFRAKSLLMFGLVLYTAGGCIAGIFSSIWMVLAARALVGIGVGIVMPLSTGLIAFYYTRDKQDGLMGWSSALNLMGGCIATLISGALSVISWRLSFLVYLLGLISIVLCTIFMPNEHIASREDHKKASEGAPSQNLLKDYYQYIVAMFLLMFAFFIYPSDFAMETVNDGIIPEHLIAVVMAGMDLMGFVGGLAYVHIRNQMDLLTAYIAPASLIAGFLLLCLGGSPVTVVLGSFLIGFANGEGIPFIISTAAMKAGRNAGTTVLPLISAALYTAQFLTPIILGAVSAVFGSQGTAHIPYWTAVFASVVLLIWSGSIIKDGTKTMEKLRGHEDRSDL